MADNEQKAMQLMAEAEKKKTSKGLFGGLFGWVSLLISEISSTFIFVYDFATTWHLLRALACVRNSYVHD